MKLYFKIASSEESGEWVEFVDTVLESPTHKIVRDKHGAQYTINENRIVDERVSQEERWPEI